MEETASTLQQCTCILWLWWSLTVSPTGVTSKYSFHKKLFWERKSTISRVAVPAFHSTRAGCAYLKHQGL